MIKTGQATKPACFNLSNYRPVISTTANRNTDKRRKEKEKERKEKKGNQSKDKRRKKEEIDGYYIYIKYRIYCNTQKT